MSKRISDNLKKHFSPEGKRGIVTGGSNGLGKSISLTLAEAASEIYIFNRIGGSKGATEEKT